FPGSRKPKGATMSPKVTKVRQRMQNILDTGHSLSPALVVHLDGLALGKKTAPKFIRAELETRDTWKLEVDQVVLADDQQLQLKIFITSKPSSFASDPDTGPDTVAVTIDNNNQPDAVVPVDLVAEDPCNPAPATALVSAGAKQY